MEQPQSYDWDREPSKAYFEFVSVARPKPNKQGDPSFIQKLIDLRDYPQPKDHLQEREELRQRLRALFKELRLSLLAGFKVVLYGLGSKVKLLEEFAERWLSDRDVFCIYGHREGAEEAFKQPVEPSSIYLIHNVHLLEGATSILNDPRISAIVTVNDEMVQGRNVVYYDFTTLEYYLPDELEVVKRKLKGTMGSKKKRARSVESALFVLNSLNHNAHLIYGLICENQPVQERELFRLASERLLVSSESALKAILQEFKDHELVEDVDGGKLRTPWTNQSKLNQFTSLAQAPSN